MNHIRKSPIIAKSKFEASELRATFNHVWTLPPDKRDQLGIYILVKTTVGELINKIDTSHNYIDFLTYPVSPTCHLTCRVNFVNGSVSYLHELIESGKESDICLVSIRMARVEYHRVHADFTEVISRETTTVALVLINPDNIEIEKLKCYSLDGKEIVS